MSVSPVALTVTCPGSGEPQGAADRWLLGAVCLADVAAMPDDLPGIARGRDLVVDALRVAGMYVSMCPRGT